MKLLYISKDKKNGNLIYASSNYKHLEEMTKKYFRTHHFKIDFEITAVIGIEPLTIKTK